MIKPRWMLVSVSAHPMNRLRGHPRIFYRLKIFGIPVAQWQRVKVIRNA